MFELSLVLFFVYCLFWLAVVGFIVSLFLKFIGPIIKMTFIGCAAVIFFCVLITGVLF